MEELYGSSIQRDVGDGAGFVNTTVGIFHFQRTGGTEPTFNVSDFYAFCVEPREFVSPQSTYLYDYSPLESGATNIGGMGTARANRLRELYARYFPNFWAVQSLNATTAGALQIATWEIVRENSGTLNVLTGNTRFQNPANAAALTLAQTYLDSLNGSVGLTNLHALTRIGAQDLVVQDVPEPAWLGAVGVVLIVLSQYRRRPRS